jgi:hypothetical protein
MYSILFQEFITAMRSANVAWLTVSLACVMCVTESSDLFFYVPFSIISGMTSTQDICRTLCQGMDPNSFPAWALDAQEETAMGSCIPQQSSISLCFALFRSTL